ncbi:MAG TPA: L-fucose/L-arabinose isomerase family protein [Terriglobales bacterium]|nr:L-fucose/L-arabinose isomerase family protein [Terriglobales bacterium]
MPLPTTFALLVGNRGFFPAQLVRAGREEMLRVLKEHGYGVVCLDATATPEGAVGSLEDARRCAALFRAHREDIAGVIVTLPNFGDERAAADAIRLAGLDVPVLVHAYPDEPGQMLIDRRRDSFCGKISLCNNLVQYGIPFTLTERHTVPPASEAFRADLAKFAATCRIVRGLRGLRVGIVGARPAAFNTVRFSEKLLEREGITVEPLDLSEVLGRVRRLGDDEPGVRAKLAAIRGYIPQRAVPEPALLKMAKFGAVLDAWMAANGLAGTSIQCWTALEEYFGIAPCTLMSMMSESLLPSACETDVTGMLAMHVLQLATGGPSAIVDWNNNYGDDPDAAVLFHCSNLPKSFFAEAEMHFQEIIAGTVGKENTFGTIVGPLAAGPISFCRITTDDAGGRLRAYAGEGEITADRPKSFGGFGVARIPRLQKLLHFVCREGFEHHVAINHGRAAAAIAEALGNYRRWPTTLWSAEERC